MPNTFFQLNFDEVASIAKQFKDEGEDIARLHSETRRRVRDLHKEWIGEGAEKFFEEMETKLLPALQRLSLALFHTQDIANEIMKIIRNADEETVGFFREQLSGDDFGAGKFGDALNGLGNIPGSADLDARKLNTTSSDDFGANKFGQALDGSGSGSNDSGAGQQHDTTSSGGGQNESDHQKEKKQEDKQTDTQAASGGGGSGSGSSSEGLKGDLKNMGTGLGSVTPQDAVSGGGGAGGPTNAPDHIYSSGGSPDVGGTSQPVTEGGASNEDQSATGAGAGVAGAAGAAAAGGAAKATRGKKKKNSGE